MPKSEQGERCQLCGSLVEVVSSDEGTLCYRPVEQGNVQPWRKQIERVREALRTYGTWRQQQAVRGKANRALDALTTQIEELEEQSAFNASASKEHMDRYLRERDEAWAQIEELERIAPIGRESEIERAERKRAEAAEARAEKAERALGDLTEVVDLARIDLLGDTSRVQVKRRLDAALRPEETSDES